MRRTSSCQPSMLGMIVKSDPVLHYVYHGAGGANLCVLAGYIFPMPISCLLARPSLLFLVLLHHHILSYHSLQSPADSPTNFTKPTYS